MWKILITIALTVPIFIYANIDSNRINYQGTTEYSNQSITSDRKGRCEFNHTI